MVEKRVAGEGGVMRGGDPAGPEVDGGDASGECKVQREFGNRGWCGSEANHRSIEMGRGER